MDKIDTLMRGAVTLSAVATYLAAAADKSAAFMAFAVMQAIVVTYCIWSDPE